MIHEDSFLSQTKKKAKQNDKQTNTTKQNKRQKNNDAFHLH